MRPYGTPKQLENRRRRAIALLQAGKPYRLAAKIVTASLSSVVRWHQAYRKKKLQGLRPRPTPGRPCQLSKGQRKRLKRLLLRGPLKEGYTTDLWTLKRIAKLIEKYFGVRYTVVGVWKLMRQGLVWSCQKPERRATQRNEEAIARWKKYIWPHIKKSQKTPGLSRFSRRKRISAYPQRP